MLPQFAWRERIVEDLGASAFVIKKENKVLYHVFGSFASPSGDCADGFDGTGGAGCRHSQAGYQAGDIATVVADTAELS